MVRSMKTAVTACSLAAVAFLLVLAMTALPLRPLQAAGCLQATAFGAIANDGLDDRAAVQAAIDAAPVGGCVELPSGQTDVMRPPAGLPNPDRLSDLRTRKRIRIIGAGTTLSTLSLSGSSRNEGRRLLEFLPGSDGSSVADLTFVGVEIDSGQQTHLLQLTGIAGFTAERLAFSLPPVGDTTGGDCLRAIDATDVVVSRVSFVMCDRSAVSLQRGNKRWRVSWMTAVGTGDTDFELEPTGVVGPEQEVDDITLEDFSFVKTTAPPGITLTRGNRFAVRRGVIAGGSGIFVNTGRDSVIDRVTVTCTVPGAPCVIVRRDSDRFTLSRNLVKSAGGAAAIRVFADDLGQPADVTIENNRIEQVGPYSAVEADDVDGLRVLDNDMPPPAGVTVQVAAVVLRKGVGIVTGPSAKAWTSPPLGLQGATLIAP